MWMCLQVSVLHRLHPATEVLFAFPHQLRLSGFIEWSIIQISPHGWNFPHALVWRYWVTPGWAIFTPPLTLSAEVKKKPQVEKNHVTTIYVISSIFHIVEYHAWKAKFDGIKKTTTIRRNRVPTSLTSVFLASKFIKKQAALSLLFLWAADGYKYTVRANH